MIRFSYIVFLVTNSSTCGSQRHSPIVKAEDGTWVDLNSNKIVDLEESGMWFKGQPNGQDLQNCTVFHVGEGKFTDTDCFKSSCYICAWKNEPLFQLRGLCSNSYIDTLYALLPTKTYNESLLFFGLLRNNILYSQQINSWLIVEDKLKDLITPTSTKMPSKVLGVFQPDKYSNQLPVGTHLWNITDPNCKGRMSLKLSSVSHFYGS